MVKMIVLVLKKACLTLILVVSLFIVSPCCPSANVKTLHTHGRDGIDTISTHPLFQMVRFATAYGKSAAVNAVENLRRNEQRIFEEEKGTMTRASSPVYDETDSQSASSEEGRLTDEERESLDKNRNHRPDRDIGRKSNGSERVMGPIVLIPGFGSSRLRATEDFKCKNGGGRYKIGDDVWLDVARILGPQQSCWLNCISLNPGDDESDLRCRTRPDEGLDAILQLQPGMFTGHPSEIFASFIGGLVKTGFVPVRDIIALPYDWRLSPMKLQNRDRYFNVMRRMIELMVETHKSPDIPREESRVTLISHSLGSNVVRYFLDWMKQEVGANNLQAWIDDNIGTFVAVSAPLLGSPDTVKGVMSGHTFGALPVTQENCRRMALSFGSSPWMLPIDMRKVFQSKNKSHKGLKNYLAVVNGTTSWPVPIALEFDEETSNKAKDLICNNTMLPDMNTVTGGDLFRTLGEFDSQFSVFANKIDMYNEADILEPWMERPPFDRVVFAFGTNLQTAISHRWKFRKDYGPFKRWQHLERIYEDKGGKILRSPKVASLGIGSSTGMSKSGDQVVPYMSLAFCHTWLPDKVNITRVPQRLHTPNEVLAMENISVEDFERQLQCATQKECAGLESKGNISSTTSPTELYDTFYEARWLNSVGRPMHTYIWEFEGQTHRELLRSDIFMRELVAELLWVSSRQKAAQPRLKQVVWEEMIDSASTRRSERAPTNDSQCYWDYWDMGCIPSEYCNYQYKFGDIRLSQSCRLRAVKTETEALTQMPSARQIEL